MIEAAIQTITELAAPTLIDGAPGFKQSSKPLHAIDVREPQNAILSVETLQGLIDGVSGLIADPKAIFAYVVSPTCVQIADIVCDKYGRRAVHLQAKLPEFKSFPFDNFLHHEQFVINLMTLFEDAGERDYVISMAQKVTAGGTVTTEDDGITQSAVIQKGAALKSSVTLKARVKLAPFRTFREVPQPVSEFVFRLSQDGDGKPQLMLKESDGGAWRIDAIEAIRTWLVAKLGPGIPIIA